MTKNLPYGFRILSASLLMCVNLGLLHAEAAERTIGQPGQTPALGKVQVGHDSWTFKEGAPADVQCLAQTNDGFLWLGGPNGLFRFDGTRFEPFSSPFGDRLLSNNLYSLFAPPSGGLWIGYTLGGFSFLDKGRVTNYASGIGSVYGFAQDRDGIVWAGTSSGLWRFDHSGWQHLGVEWNGPAGRVTQVGFDSEGILWASFASLRLSSWEAVST